MFITIFLIGHLHELHPTSIETPNYVECFEQHINFLKSVCLGFMDFVV